MTRRYAPIPGVRVIGFTGKARHGKDTLALELMKRWPGAERFAFSDAIAAHLRARGLMKERDPRVMVQHGMAIRNENPWVWTDALYYALQDRRPAVALVTGVRMDTEVQMVRDCGGTLVRVVREDFIAGDRDPAHRTETEQGGFDVDYIITAKDVLELRIKGCGLLGLLVGDVKSAVKMEGAYAIS